MNFSAISVELKIGTPMVDSILPEEHRGAELQESDGIARAVIVDLKIYPGMPILK